MSSERHQSGISVENPPSRIAAIGYGIMAIIVAELAAIGAIELLVEVGYISVTDTGYVILTVVGMVLVFEFYDKFYHFLYVIEEVMAKDSNEGDSQ